MITICPQISCMKLQRRAVQDAAHGLAVPGVAGLLNMWGMSHLHNKER